MERLQRKWQTTVQYLPEPEIFSSRKASSVKSHSRDALICYGSSRAAMNEALDNYAADGEYMDGLCIKAFPFADLVATFIDKHDRLFLIEQNRDAQMKTLLVNEFGIDPKKLVSVLHYHGSPITAVSIIDSIEDERAGDKPQAKEA